MSLTPSFRPLKNDLQRHQWNPQSSWNLSSSWSIYRWVQIDFKTIWNLCEFEAPFYLNRLDVNERSYYSSEQKRNKPSERYFRFTQSKLRVNCWCLVWSSCFFWKRLFDWHIWKNNLWTSNSNRDFKLQSDDWLW